MDTLTYGRKEAHDQQDDDTPEHVHVHLPLQLAALVARSVVVQHGFGLVTWEEPTVRRPSQRLGGGVW